MQLSIPQGVSEAAAGEPIRVSYEQISLGCHPWLTRLEHDQNEHVYAIYCRPEVAGDVIYGNVRKIPNAVASLSLTKYCFFCV